MKKTCLCLGKAGLGQCYLLPLAVFTGRTKRNPDEIAPQSPSGIPLLDLTIDDPFPLPATQGVCTLSTPDSNKGCEAMEAYSKIR